MSPADFFAPRDELPRAWPGALVLSVLWLAVALFLTATHYLPTHDAIGWHGVYHYFAEALGEGRFPWWNPYGRGGEPFFPYLQLIGLLQPTYLPFIALQKLAELPSVTAYSLHYFFQIYIFLLGSYLAFHAMARNAAAAVVFALVALAGLLPSMVMQNGIMNGCTYVPLAHYFAIRFFEARHSPSRGPWLFALAVTVAVSLNAWVPTAMLLFLTSLAVGLLVSGRPQLRAAYAWLRERASLRWAAVSLVVSLLLAGPVLALFAEFRLVDELFPLIRLLQHGNFRLPQCFASDLQVELFSERFTDQDIIALKPQKLAGMLFEPILVLDDIRYLWESVFFVGAFTLICALFGLARARSPWKAGLVLLLMLSILAAVDFGGEPGNPSATQRLIRTALPFLAMTDVAEILGALVVYAFAGLAALGLPAFARSIPAMLAAILAPLVFKFFPDWGLLDRTSPLLWALCAAVLVGLGIAAYRGTGPAERRWVLMGLSLSVIAFEAFHFANFYLVDMERLTPGYYAYLERTGILMGSRESSFAMRREPYAFNDGDRMDRVQNRMTNPFTVYGRDAMAHEKSAWPNILRMFTDPPEAWRRFPIWDHIFATRQYYDFLVNVDVSRQLAPAGITCPILRVVSVDATAAARSPQQAAAALNSTEPGAPQLVLMHGYSPDAAAAQAADRCFAGRGSVRALTEPQRQSFLAEFAAPCKGVDQAAPVKVLEHDENRVVVQASGPAEGGFLYYADGYSRHWRASIDGVETPVLVGNLAFKAVRLPPGSHTVEFRYRPVLFRASVQLYYLGLALAAAVLAWAALRRTGRASSPSA